MNKLPNEIIRLIFSFGYPEHRQHVRVLNEKIKNNQFIRSCIFDMIYDDIYMFIRLNPIFSHGITKVFKMYPLQVKRKIFSLCITCVCCETHCSNRPRTLDYTSTTPFQVGTRCGCRCRSIARRIHAAYRFPVEHSYSSHSIVIRNLK